MTKTEAMVINQLMAVALSKIAFLPFGLLVDKWRWSVFGNATLENRYNKAWWDLRLIYQGIAPPLEEWGRHKNESFFDPGAKYHITSNTPYMRYFLAHILQFQFHKALCEAAGHRGPLHQCSVNGSLAAGRRLQQMLSLGASKTWQDALRQLTGGAEANLNASVMVEYFEPLMQWLRVKNEGQMCGWKADWALAPEEFSVWRHMNMILELSISGAFAFVVLLSVILLIRRERKIRRHNAQQAIDRQLLAESGIEPEPVFEEESDAFEMEETKPIRQLKKKKRNRRPHMSQDSDSSSTESTTDEERSFAL
jgi:hypothetical protein